MTCFFVNVFVTRAGTMFGVKGVIVGLGIGFVSKAVIPYVQRGDLGLVDESVIFRVGGQG